MKKGVLFAAAAYAIWGFFPILFKVLKAVPAFQIMTHRVVWCFLLLVLLVLFRREWHVIKAALTPRNLLIYLAAGVILSFNWFIYIWGVNAGFIVETSLGYFINPLINVLLGVVFLGEHMRPAQWVSIGLAALGVAYLTIAYGSLPWLALSLAGSFGLYGLIKKIGPLDSLPGLFLETGAVFLPALGFLVYEELRGVGSFGHVSGVTTALLVFSGILTATSLLLFSGGIRRVPLTTMGLLQFISPTIQFFIGVVLYHEPFPQARVIGFSTIWIALVIYTIEGFLNHRKVVLALG